MMSLTLSLYQTFFPHRSIALLRCIALYWLVSTVYTTSAQNIPLGTWRTHTSYRSIPTLSVAGERIYGGTEGGLFYYDKVRNESSKLSKLDGLSEASVTQIHYDAAQHTLLIAYQSGNLDLLKLSQQPGGSDQLVNVPILKQANLPGNQAIHHIAFRENDAYLSGDFGMVVLNLTRKEIRETYRSIGPQASNVAVYAATFSHDSLFMATSVGVLATSMDLRVNRQDYTNWKRFDSEQLPAVPIRSITSRNGKVYASVSGQGIYVYEKGVWRNQIPTTDTVHQLATSANQVLICQSNQLLLLDEQDHLSTLQDTQLKAIRQAEYDQQGKLWVADSLSGLFSNRSGQWENYLPNGPASNQIWSLYAYQHQVLALFGGIDNQGNALHRPANFSVYDGATWQTHTPEPASGSTVYDLVAAAYLPAQQQLYLGSFGDGLFVQKNNLTPEAVTPTPLVASRNGISVTGMAVDMQGNLWITNHGVPAGKPSLHVLKADNTWQSYTFGPIYTRNPLGVLIDRNNYKWLRLDPKDGGGMLVFDEVNNQSRYLSTAVNSGALPNANVRAMALDQEGQIWVGTDDGVAIFVNTNEVFDGNYAAYTPIFEGRQLLNNQFVTAMAVDGGNRKWIGTRNGLWLFNADGSELIANFTAQNSPLPSDYITALTIHPTTGEVFIGTQSGLVSYRGTATEGNNELKSIRVFPNPVRPGFEGLVGISGLTANASVKITDVSGKLIYQTQSNGGTATWNVRDYQGNRAAAGVYLVFVAAEDGRESLVSKLAIIK